MEISKKIKDKKCNLDKNKMDDKQLERRAVEEIFKEIAKKHARAQELGPTGWLDCPLRKTNKRFLNKTIRAAVFHNERKSSREKFSSEKKLLELDYDKKPSRRPKLGERKHIYKKPFKQHKK